VVVMDARDAKRVRGGKGDLQSAAGVKLHVMKAGQKFWFRED